MPHRHAGFSRFGYVLLALVAIGWGVNWPIMKLVLWDVPPLTFRGGCLFAGGVGILTIAHFAGYSLAVPRREWSALFWLTAFNIIGWNLFAIYGLALLPSGRAALLGYTMPLWSIPLSAWLLHEKLTRQRLAGLVLGMIGVFVLISADLARMSRSLLGVGLMLCGAICWGLGVVLLKRFTPRIPTITLSGWMMLGGGLPVTLAALALEHDAWRPVGLYPALGLIYNAVVVFMFCYWAWNRIVFMVPVAVSSLSALVTPVIGVISGMLMLGEQPTWRELIAGLLILGSIALVVRETRRKQDVRPADGPVA